MQINENQKKYKQHQSKSMKIKNQRQSMMLLLRFFIWSDVKDTVSPEASHSREPASAPQWYTSRVPPSQGQVGLYGSGGSGPSVVFTSLRWGGLWGYGAYRFWL